MIDGAVAAEAAKAPADYRARALERAAAFIEASVAGKPDGYHKFWTLVDVAVLRAEAARLLEGA